MSMLRRGSFITIHGIDGTGKSTLASALCDELNANSQDAVLFEQLNLDNPFADNKPNFANLHPQARVFYSLGSKAVESTTIASASAQRHVVKDRWVIDVLADQSYCGATIDDSLFGLLSMPDLAVLLTCQEDERMRRIQERGGANANDLVPNIEGTRARYFEQFLMDHLGQSAGQCMQLDSSNVPAVELAKQIAGRI